MVSIRQITTPDTTTSGAVGQSSGKVKITQIKAGTPTGSLPTSTSGGVNLNQVEAPKVTIKQLNEKTNAFSSPSEVKTSKVTITPIQQATPQKKSFLQSLKETVFGGAKNTAASDVNALGNLYDIGQNRRTAEYIEQRDQYKKELDRWKNAYAEDIAAGESYLGDPYYENTIADIQRKYDAFNKVVEDEVQQKATQATYEMADKISESAAENIAKAKELTPLPGLVGDIAVDAGASLVQTAGDALGNAVLGGPSMLPFAFRAYGGGTQAARKDGADTLGKQVAYGVASAAKEVFTEKMFNIASPFKKVYGEGTMDDLMTKAVDKVVGKLVKSETGKKVITQLVSGAIGEGLEEFIGDWMEWQMPRIYNGDVDTAADTLSQSLYDFAVGATSGLIGDIGGQTFEAGINKIAGNNQKATAEKTEAVKAEIGAGKNTGVQIETETDRQAQFSQAEKIANNFGAQFKVEALQNGVSGEYQDGTITIDPNTKNPVRSVLVHELTHHMEASGTYNEFSNLVLDYISKDMGADIDALKQSIITEYAEGGFELTDADAQKELVAKFAENKLFQDEKAINRLCRENRTVFQQIYDWITDAIAMVRGTSEEQFLIKAQRMYENALRSQENAQKTGKVTITPVSAQAQQLFAGQNARTADFNALNTAMQMESQGSNAESILKATGWFRGMDGKWRFEIDDSAMKYAYLGDAEFSERNPDYARMKDYIKKQNGFILGLNEDLTSEEKNDYTELKEKYNSTFVEPGYVGPGALKQYRLESYIKHPALYEAYPELRGVTLEFRELPEGTRGSYNPKTNTIVVDSDLQKWPQEVIVHEIQHAIQSIENFSQGSSPEYYERNPVYKKDYSDRIDRAKEKLDSVTAAFNADSHRFYLANRYKELTDLLFGDEQIDEDGLLDELDQIEKNAEKDGWSKLLTDYLEADAEYEMAKAAAKRHAIPAVKAYSNTVGEIEARDAARRMKYSSEQRQNLSPDIRTEDLVFNDGNVAISSNDYNRIVDESHDVKRLPTAEEIMDPDSDYNKAIQSGDIEKAQEMVNAAAERNGYIPDSGYQGTSAFNGSAPSSNGYFETKEERIEAWNNDEFEGDASLGDYKDGIDINNLDFFLNDARAYRNGNRYVRESIDNLNKALRSRDKTITMYRSVPAGVKENSFRNGDWISPSKAYAIENAAVHSGYPGWENGYRIIEQKVSIEDIWWDGNDINEWGFDDGKSYAYQNTENNLKLLDPATYDDEGNVIPLSKRFNAQSADPRESYGRSFDQLIEDYRLKTAEEILAEEPAKVEAETEALEEPKHLPTAEEIMARDKLPAKASIYLRGVEKGLFNRLSGVLDAAKFEDKGFIQEAVRDISNEYLQTGKVSAETVDRLFNSAYEQARVAKADMADTAKSVSQYLRNHKVYVPEGVKHEFSDDWNSFRKRMLGYGLTLTNNPGDAGVDQIVQEANEMFGNVFDEYDQHEALLQMQSMFEEASDNSTTLSEKYGSEEEDFKAWAKRDFEIAVNDTISELNRVKRYSDERLAKTAEEHKITPEEIENAYSVLRTRRKAAEKAVAKNLLTEKDEAVVGRLLRGEMQLEDVDPAQFNYKGIKAVYEAKAQYEEVNKIVKKASKARKEELRAEAAKYLKDANQWKDKGAGILYSRETMWRNLRDIVRGEVSAQQVIDYLLTPIRQNNAKQTKFLNKHRDTIKDLDLSRKIEAGNEVSESYAVQLLGEAEDNIKTIQESNGRIQEREGKTVEDWKGEIDNLKVKNPNLDWDKINIAIETFRAEYDEMLMQANEVLVRNGYEPIPRRKGYFPHFQSEDTDGVFGTFKKLFGIETEVTDLPTTINGLTGMFRPGKAWFGSAMERQGIHTDYDAVKGFDKYVQGISDVIYHTDDIQRVRAFAAEARYRTSDEGLQKQIDEIRSNDFLTEMDKDAKIAELYKDGKYALSNFVVELDEYANLLANKKSRGDRNIEQKAGRKIFDILKTAEGNIASNMVAVNPASWLTNFIPISQAWSTVDSQSILKGMADTLKGYKANDGFVGRSDYLTSRFGSDSLIENWNKEPNATGLKKVVNAWKKGVNKLSGGMDVVDNFTSEAIVRARYNYNIKNGMSEANAMAEADQWAAALQAGRSKGEMPTLFSERNPLTKLFTQFQLEVNNELSWLVKDVPDDLKKKGMAALVAGLWKFLIGSFIYNEVYEYFIGRRSALDPLGLLNDTVGDLTGYKLPNLIEAGRDAISGQDVDFTTQKAKGSEAVTNTLKNVGEEMPFVGNILGGGRLPAGNVLPDFENVTKALFNDNWSKEKKLATLRKELVKPIAYGLIPGAGSQVKKTVEGIEAIIKGGSYSVDKDGNPLLQYPIFEDTTADKIGATTKALLFGKSSMEEARKWVEGGFNTLTAKETALYQQLVENEVSDRDAWKFVNDFTSISKTETESANILKRRFISESDISGEAKCLALSSMLTSEKDIVLLEGMLSSGSDPEDVAQTMIAVKDADALESGKGTAVREAIYNSKLEDSDKMAIYIAKVSNSKSDEIKDCLRAGLSMNDYLRFDIDISGVSSDKKKTKQEKIAEIIDSYDISNEQKDALYLTEYSDSNLDKAPWRDLTLPELKLPKLELPELELPELPKYLPKY